MMLGWFNPSTEIKSALAAITIACLCMAPSTLLAQDDDGDAAWVNDRVFLSLYPEPDSSTDRLTLLQTGDQLIRLGSQEGNFVQVATEDGTEGWVNADFVVEEPPARLRIEAVEEERNELASALEAQSAEMDLLQTRLAELQAERDQLASTLAATEDGSEEQPGQTRILNTELHVPWPAHLPEPGTSTAAAAQEHAESAALGLDAGEWALMGLLMALSLLVGLFWGYLWREKRIRQRFGGLSL